MKAYLKIILCFMFAIGVMAVNLGVSFAQENAGVSTSEQTAVSNPESTAVSTPESTEIPVQGNSDVLKKEISGKITSVDLENSTLAVKRIIDENANTSEDAILSVVDSTIIEKDYEKKGLADLSVGDESTVEYTTGSDGSNIASYIGIKTKEKENKE